MNSYRDQIPTIAIVLLIVGLVVGASVGYFFVSSTFKQKTKDYEATTLAMEQVITTYESRVSDLEGEITGYEYKVNDLELQLNETTSENLISDTHTEVEIGQTFTIILKSNPTTGFGWQLAKPLNEDIVKFIDSQFRTLATEYPPPAGVGGIEIWTFEGMGIGTTEIFMEYLRPWEDAPPVKEQAFVVTVK